MKTFRKFIAALPLALGLSLAQASEGGFPLDHFPVEKLTDVAALQSGAKLFVNYCLNCHGASSMRYNRLQDIGLTEDQIRKNLLFSAEKVGELMKVAITPEDAKEWFGALPPDLSVIARARASGGGSGADWLYTYLRSYYRDSTRATGWNNALFENVGMPHVFWELQGTRGVTIEETKPVKDEKTAEITGFQKVTVAFDAAGQRSEKAEKLEGKNHHEKREFLLGKAEGGKLSQSQYDETVADLVAYLTYMADPSARARTQLGVWVLLFLSILMVLAWWLNREYWKDVK
ncbi:MAG: cytochrome c1 [Burkholderiaceae bacterium]|nr:cytochrome c1 [Burkholderiaceae bacterium]